MIDTNFYIYILFRDDGTPFYVGKGNGNRWNQHELAVRNKAKRRGENLHKTNIIRKMFAAGWTEVPKIKIAERLTREKACEYEIAWITALGRRPDGPLVNRTNGGDGTAAPSEETRQKMRAAKLGKKPSEATLVQLRMMNVGRKHANRRGPACSEATRQKIRIAKLGKKRPEVGAKVRVALRGRKLSEEHRQKIVIALIGRPVSEATRQKHRGFRHSEATRAKIGAASKGRAR
jgi:hypothetical protein